MKGLKRIIAIALALALSIGTMTTGFAAINYKAPVVLSKTIGSTTVNKFSSFTVNYTFTPNSIPFSSIESNNTEKEVVLVLDRSGSMGWDLSGKDGGKPTRLSIAQQAALSFIEKLKEVQNIKVSFVQYNNSATISNWYQLSDSSQYDNLKAAIQSNTLGGGTNIGDAIRLGKYKLANGSSTAKKYFVLLTDGEPTKYSYTGSSYGSPLYQYADGAASKISSDNVTRALEYAKLMSGTLTYNGNNYFIAFSTSVTNSNKLSDIAAQCNGTYSEATTSEALNQVYQKIADDITSEFSLTNMYFEESYPSAFEILSTSGGVARYETSQTVKGSFSNVNYKLNTEKTYYTASPISFSVTLKANQDGTYILGANNSSYMRYTDIDETLTVKPFSPLTVKVNDYNPLSDTDPAANQVKVDTADTYTSVNIGWDNGDPTGIEYSLLGNAADGSDEYFTIDKSTGKIDVKNMSTLKTDLATKGFGIIEKYVKVDTNNVASYLVGTSEAILTTEKNNQVGVFQSQATLDLSKKNEVNFEINLGTRESDGADGIIFVLNEKAFKVDEHTVTAGGGLGYDKQSNQGVGDLFDNSVGFEFDTWTNKLKEFTSVQSPLQQDCYKDKTDDHIALVQNAAIAHVYSGGVSYSSTNNKTVSTSYGLNTSGSQVSGSTGGQFTTATLEDGKWRKGQVVWDPVTDKLTLNFDLNADGTISSDEQNIVTYANDLTTKFPSGQVYFGFTAATGGSYNVQKIRSISIKEDNQINESGNLFVKAVKKSNGVIVDGPYYMSVDFDVVSQTNAINAVTREMPTTTKLDTAFNITYTPTGVGILLDTTKIEDSYLVNPGAGDAKYDKIKFKSLTYTETFPVGVEVVSPPTGFTLTDNTLSGELKDIYLVKDKTTGLYHVNGSFVVTVKISEFDTYKFDQGTVSFITPNDGSGKVNIQTGTIVVLDPVPPVITVNVPKGFVIAEFGDDQLTLTAMLDGTGSEIISAQYIMDELNSDSKSVTDFEESKLAKTSLDLAKAPSYVDSIPDFKKVKDAGTEFIQFSQFKVTENGDYWVYTVDAAGNKAVKLVRITTILNNIPDLT